MPRTQQINYKAGDGTNWTGSIQNVDRVRLFDARIKTSDPKWVHTKEGGRPSQSDDKICYVYSDGTIWWAKVRAHSELRSDHASFDFIHWPDSSHTIGQYLDTKMIFKTWDGSFQQVVRVYELNEEIYLDVEPYVTGK